MKRIVVWTTFATECLDQIEQYIIWRTGSKTIAGNFLSKIIKRAEQIRSIFRIRSVRAFIENQRAKQQTPRYSRL